MKKEARTESVMSKDNPPLPQLITPGLSTSPEVFCQGATIAPLLLEFRRRDPCSGRQFGVR